MPSVFACEYQSRSNEKMSEGLNFNPSDTFVDQFGWIFIRERSWAVSVKSREALAKLSLPRSIQVEG